MNSEQAAYKDYLRLHRIRYCTRCLCTEPDPCQRILPTGEILVYHWVAIDLCSTCERNAKAGIPPQWRTAPGIIGPEGCEDL